MKTLQGTLTVLKDKEGNIKIPRTTASAVQFVSGKTLESTIEDMYSKSEIDTMFANLTKSLGTLILPAGVFDLSKMANTPDVNIIEVE